MLLRKDHKVNLFFCYRVYVGLTHHQSFYCVFSTTFNIFCVRVVNSPFFYKRQRKFFCRMWASTHIHTTNIPLVYAVYPPWLGARSQQPALINSWQCGSQRQYDQDTVIEQCFGTSQIAKNTKTTYNITVEKIVLRTFNQR